MRIWDLPVQLLCDKHLRAEHYELHSIWNIITGEKKGYSRHPETMRWRGKLRALYSRHKQQVAEATRRKWKMGLNHQSPLDYRLATGKSVQDVYVHTPEEQVAILRVKGCDCDIRGMEIWLRKQKRRKAG